MATSRRLRGCVTAKLIQRHPHVFGDEAAASAGAVRRRWEEIKRDDEGREGVFHDVPEGLPALLYARKVQLRARSVGSSTRIWPARSRTSTTRCASFATSFPHTTRRPTPSPTLALAAELGDVLFAAVNVARRLNVDPELELRAATKRFRARVDQAVELAAKEGEDWTELPLDEQDAYYDEAKEL